MKVKKIIVLLIALTVSWAVGATECVLGTYNIRIATSRDKGDINWANRKSFVVQTIRDNHYDILSLNEIKSEAQEQDIRQMLPDYDLVTYGRESAERSEGERVGVLFATKRFELIKSGHFFLTENPEQPGLGWDATYNRVAVWVLLRDKKSNKQLAVLSTHLDYQGTEARKEGTKLCIQRLEQVAPNVPRVIMGDLNAEPNETAVHQLFKEAGFKDARMVSKHAPKGSYGTFTSWIPMPTNQRIDYIYLKGDVQVKTYRVEDKNYGRPVMPSDHRALVCKIKY